MLASRVIPVMLVKGQQLVKGRQFDNSRVVGVALQAARIHANREVDELMILDVAATSEHRTIDLKLVRDLTRDCYVPVTAGGGVTSLLHIDRLLRAGADKVLIGAAASIQFISQAAERFGNQAIVVSIDFPDRTIVDAEELVMAGAGELLLNNRMRDGTMLGYDLELIRDFAHLPVPVIACGGCSGYEDMLRAFHAGASAAAAGALFQFEDCTPKGAAQYLRSKGMMMRIPQ
jgi:imidazole glycerol-phosphate synthase subunit HisF